MLQQVLEHIHNYFVKSSVAGAFTVSGGSISGLDFLKEGQRFLIKGSDLNDGVYTYSTGAILDDDGIVAAGLADEDFDGTVCAMAVPPAVIALSAEISDWVEKYGAVINSPYTSESFGGYSYTRATAGGTDGSTGSVGWQEVFKSRLNRWRKVAF